MIASNRARPSRKRTSSFCGCTFTSTLIARRAAGTPRRPDSAPAAARCRRRSATARASDASRTGRPFTNRCSPVRRCARARAPEQRALHATPSRSPSNATSASPANTCAARSAKLAPRANSRAARPSLVSESASAGLRQRGARADRRDVPALGRPRLQELEPRGHVEEQIAHLDGGARRAADLARARLAAAVDSRPACRPAHRARAWSARSRDTDAIEGSASPRKPSVAIALQVLDRAQLARGVAPQRRAARRPRSCPLPSSTTRMRAQPAVLDLDLDRAWRRHRRHSRASSLTTLAGPLHDLAGGDLVAEGVIEHTNVSGHGRNLPREARGRPRLTR